MTLGTIQEGYEEIIATEKYSFSRNHFPMRLHGHRIRILKNKMYERRDGKLRVRVHLECGKCFTESHSISETVPMLSRNKREMILLYALSSFVTSDCT
jgi:hypothetical protein